MSVVVIATRRRPRCQVLWIVSKRNATAPAPRPLCSCGSGLPVFEGACPACFGRPRRPRRVCVDNQPVQHQLAHSLPVIDLAGVDMGGFFNHGGC